MHMNNFLLQAPILKITNNFNDNHIIYNYKIHSSILNVFYLYNKFQFKTFTKLLTLRNL